MTNNYMTRDDCAMFVAFIAIGLVLGSAAMIKRAAEFEDFFGRYE